LPTIWRNPWYRIAQAVLAMLALVFLGILLWGIIDRDHIVKRWPEIEPLYDVVGLWITHPGDGLSLYNINSERRFEDGSMQLVVTGEIRNDTDEPQTVPNIQASAVGTDNEILHHWQIVAPATTLAPGVSVSFHSTIQAPATPVIEVNLSFSEILEHDDGNGR